MTSVGDLLLEPVRNGIYKQAEHHGRGAKIVNMGELFGYPRLEDIPMKRVEVSDDELERFHLQCGDLLFARRSLVAEGAGAVCLVVAASEATVFESSIIRARPDPSKVDSRYLFYWFRSPIGKAALASILRQTAVSGVTGKDLMRLQIDLLDPQAQIRAADILTMLDDKIALNQQMAATIEASAQMLFKSWFIDFFPVHQAQAGKSTALPAELATLFPSQFADDGYPDGWVPTALSKLANFLNGLALQKYPPTDDVPSLPVIKIAEMRTGTKETSARATSSLPSTDYIVENGNHLFSWSGSLMHCLWSYGPGALNQHLFRVIPTSAPAWLCYFAVDHFLPEFQRIAAAKAVTMGHIQRRHLDQAILAIPPKALLAQLGNVFEPMFERLKSLPHECHGIVTLRETLLPKLVSGELSIRDAEGMAERA